MYHDFFGIDAPPFKITPNLGLFYSGGNRGAILDALHYAVANGEGIIKVVGEVGSGKTMLSRMLESRLSANIETIYIANPSLSRDEILYAVAADLGIPCTGQRTTLIVRELQNRLIEKHAAGRQVVVFIDEAQAMPIESLEEIRLLSNLETSTHKLLQIVLFGQPELDAHLNLPQTRQIRERITHNFHLSPLAKPDIQNYLMFRLRAVGYRGPDVFTPEAVQRIARASLGLIRRINIL
ncbi:MAG TPA: ATPase, partial [Betaproteobacteria bacterium]|nr:ATPase [Betaproteobacteria bacterium]